MKKKYLIMIMLFTFITEIFITIYFFNKRNVYKNDVVEVNELAKTIEKYFDDQSKYPQNYNYAIIDKDNNVIYQNNSMSSSIYDAYKNKDTIVDINVNNETYKILINNELEQIMKENSKIYFYIIVFISGIQLISFLVYYIILYTYTIKPFKKLNEFASRITTGNLDIPLDMDKNNNFGAFTEAFDIMRAEIKSSRIKEKKAIESKKELVAKLSHDIKSPISSIKSSSELVLAISKDEKINKYLEIIDQKSEQINTLINNLFHSTLEEMEELDINATEIKSITLYELIKNSDYLNKTKPFEIKNCTIFADRLRLQQIFDNIYTNSYKYADTSIEVTSSLKDEYLIINIKDFGDTVKDEEIPLLLKKFKRGSNVKSKDGAGLGLYISKELINKMNGELDIRNAHPGFEVILKLRII